MAQTVLHRRHTEREHDALYLDYPGRELDLIGYEDKDVEVRYGKDRWTFLQCPDERGVAHREAIIIAVKGACRGNGKHNPRGGVGVFFHPQSSQNRALFLEDAFTSQRADLHAALVALQRAWVIRTRYVWHPSPPGPWRRLRRVILKTNSQYLVGAMTDWVERWEQNGYQNAHHKSVVNEDLFRKLQAIIRKLEKLGVLVQFWRVAKADNSDAYFLATDALDAKDRRDAEFSASDVDSLAERMNGTVFFGPATPPSSSSFLSA